MRGAARGASLAMCVAREAIRPGFRECDAAAQIVAAQYEGTDGLTGDYPTIVPFVPSNRRTSATHLMWSHRRYGTGDIVNVELAGCLRRYHAPLARTFCIGRPSPRLDELAKVVVEGMDDAALDTVKPGRLAPTSRQPGEPCSPATARKSRRASGTRSASATPGLGRAHRQPSPWRRDGAADGYDPPPDRWHVDGAGRSGNQRDDRRRRDGSPVLTRFHRGLGRAG